MRMYTPILVIAVVFGQLALAVPIYGPAPNTPENIALINSGEHNQKIEELSGQFEGDIILTHEQKQAIFSNQRNGIIDLNYRWPNNVVAYFITDQFNELQAAEIVTGLRSIEAVSCVRFVERTNEVDYVEVIGENSGCWSFAGRVGEKQQLNLQLNGCVHQRVIVHEFLHVLGFYHMQSAFGRDNFVKVAWEHIEPGHENNFVTYAIDEITNFGYDYDVRSIMHYSAYSFTKDGFATLIPNDITLINNIGYYDTMSELDVKRLNTMYCDAKGLDQ